MIPIIKNIIRNTVTFCLRLLCQQKNYIIINLYRTLIINKKLPGIQLKALPIAKNTIYNSSTVNINNKLANNPISIANAFNSYFLSVAENPLNKNFLGRNTINNRDPIIYLRQNLSQYSSSMKLKNTTTFAIDKIIHSLKCNDSYCYEEISSRILKISAPYVLSPLTYIFNKILLTGTFLDRLKFSEVKPVFKKGDKN